MSRDVLETIDGALAAYGDAMRWSPEPDKAEQARAREVDTALAALMAERMAWMRARVLFDALGQAMTTLVEAMRVLAPVLDALDAEKRARLRRMHHLYRTRRVR